MAPVAQRRAGTPAPKFDPGREERQGVAANGPAEDASRGSARRSPRATTPPRWSDNASRMAKDHRPSARRIDPDDVLAGRGKPPAARDLIELIRAENPTGLDLPAKETARRYTRKARLQSLLIDRFADDLEVAPDPHEPGVVGIHYRPLDMHACHVPLDALDDDARSWAQGEIDRKAYDQAHPVVTPGPGGRKGTVGARRPADEEKKASRDPAALTPAEQVRLGQEAVAAYDYELAREHLAQALTLASGDAVAALPLLALLVDHLAADDEALGLLPRLSPAARKHPEVRLLLGLAAARAGQRELALSLLDAHRGARSVEPFVVLARAALASGDVEAIGLDLAAIRERDPIHPDLHGLEAALAARRAEERLPLEDALTRLLEGGHVDDAEARARALLARFPDSEVGRRVLRTIDERHKATQIQRLLAEADEASARAELTLALSFLRQALAAGPRGEEAASIRERTARIEATLRDRDEHAQVEKAIALLGASDRLPGLVAYLALGEAARRRVRTQVDLPHFGWLAEISPGERPRAAALAVLDLERAGAIVAEAPQAALDKIEEHGRTLQGVARRAEIERDARARLGVLRREAAERRVEQARACFEAGAVERAEALLAAELPGDLGPQERAGAEALRAQIKRAHDEKILVTTYEQRRREGALLRARDVVDTLLARVDEPLRERWAAIRGEVEAEVRKAFRVRIDTTQRPVTSLRHFNMEGLNGVPLLLKPGSRVIPFVQTWGQWVFVSVIDLASRLEQARILLRTPTPLTTLGLQVEGDRLLVVGKIGAVLELDLTDGNVLNWYDSGDPERREGWQESDVIKIRDGVDLSIHPETIDDAVLVPGTRLLWRVVQTTRPRRRVVQIVDLDRRRIVRELASSEGRMYFVLLAEWKEPLVGIVAYDDQTLVFHDGRGAPLGDGKLTVQAIPWGVVVDPRSERIVIFSSRPRNKGMEASVQWRTFTPGIGMSPEQTVDGPSGVDCAAIADPTSGLVYLWSHVGDDKSDINELRALRIKDVDPGAPTQLPSLEQLHCEVISPHAVLMHSSQSSGVVALIPTDDDFEVIELGREPPRFRPAPQVGIIPMKSMFTTSTRCEKPTGTRAAAVKALVSAMHHEPRASWPRRWQAMEQEGEVGKLIELSFALRQMRELSESLALAKWTNLKYPDHPEVRLSQASPLANVGRWHEVADLLLSTNPSGLDRGAAQHLHHLLGLALLNLGETEQARRTFERGAACEGGNCELTLLLALATPLAEATAAQDRPWTPEQLAVRKLVAMVEAADACLERGDAASALVTLDRLLVTETGEVQSLARRAEAHLRGSETDPGIFEKASALAWFCAAHAEKKPYLRRELPFPRGRWDTAKLDDVSARASQWLDATLGEAWSAPVGGL